MFFDLLPIEVQAKAMLPAPAAAGAPVGSLLDQLTAAAGTAPTALMISTEAAWGDDGLDEAAANDAAVYQWDDISGGGNHFREEIAGRGLVFKTGNRVGNKPALEGAYNATPDEGTWLRCVNALSGQIAEAAHTTMVLGEFVTPSIDSADAYINDGLYGTASPFSANFYATNRTNTLIRWLGEGASLSATEAPADTPAVIGARNGTDLRGLGFNKTLDAAGAATTHGLTPHMRIGRNFFGITGKFAAVVVWDVALSNAQWNAVVDELRAWASLDPIADPE